ncbi:GNAT family N-acetyltransferase [Pelagibaculum spongiae]|uniref:N-acetyltransferase domain-containing protein n=1 Tax=Pelagibaculum spongiae TaxID=2080658 RepID=A0A2V1H0F7_9GAMM|nr:GNAT family N-acetyltransferase [Pelagibaculum spongiae]PVZ69482.1 hypothetical protein DC094_09125 [Pelagibaculum spongiae]
MTPETSLLQWPETGLFERFLKANGQSESCGRKEKHLVLRLDSERLKGEIVAGFRLCPFANRNPDGSIESSCWLIRNMLVAEAHRGSGYGHLLLQHLIKQQTTLLENQACYAFPWQWLHDFYGQNRFVDCQTVPKPLQQVWKGLQNASKQVDAMMLLTD